MRTSTSCIARGALVLGALVSPLACGGGDEAAPPPVVPDGGGGGDAEAPEPTAGCGAATGETGFLGSQSIDVDGTKRTYELFVPDPSAAKAYPLVFVFHGDGGSGAGIRRSFDLEETSSGGAFFVYPDGLGKTWELDTPEGVGADVAFIDAIVAKVGESGCVDKKRVFAVGFSRGAYFVNQLVCRSKSGFRGVVSNSGGGPFGIQNSEFNAQGDLECPSGPVASLAIHGEKDGTVPITEGEKTRDHWKRQNGCADSSSPYDPSPCVAFDGCSVPTVWCAIPNMGHAIWDQTAKAAWSFIGRE